ncbi:hypothetical protein PSAR109036_01965 [Psychrobacter arenosus]|uniref:hypothetical protein n=1 Tax=Psychrobacter arenosus TaxID=256326 RepID=UPI001917DCEA|nr:hypothetical protein [Psychrobacter arenosus]
MLLENIKLVPGDFVYVPHLSAGTHEVKDKRGNFDFLPKLYVEIDGEDICFNDVGQSKDESGNVQPIVVAYPATQSFKHHLEKWWKLQLAKPRPRQPTHSLDVRKALERGEEPLCWLSIYPITPDSIAGRLLTIDFVYKVDDNGDFLNRTSNSWTYAELVKPSEVFTSEVLGAGHE